MLYVDPFNNNWRKCREVELMLHANSRNLCDKIKELLPYTKVLNNVVYRLGRYALDFVFCIPCVVGSRQSVINSVGTFYMK